MTCWGAYVRDEDIDRARSRGAKVTVVKPAPLPKKPVATVDNTKRILDEHGKILQSVVKTMEGIPGALREMQVNVTAPVNVDAPAGQRVIGFRGKFSNIKRSRSGHIQEVEIDGQYLYEGE